MSARLQQQEFDYIIVGAGSAGCVLANRLSADGQHQVLLIEGGGSDRHIMVQMPTALSWPMNTERFCWQFHSQPEAGLDGRSLHTPRGKGLGGSSSINGMVYVRGHACDFDQWQEEGANGWDYQHCLPYFKRAESWSGGGDEYRGGDGPVGTCNGNEMKNPLYQAFVDAGIEAGYGYTEDYNGHRQEGFGPMHMTVKDGVRASTSNAYLRPVMNRKNLTVVTHALTRKVLFQPGDAGAPVAKGVELTMKGKKLTVSARREVILSAGSVGSPQLLQLSGIGPATILKQAGVDVLVDAPGVGANLQDHLEVYFQYQCTQPVSLNNKLGLLSKGRIGTEWILFKTGLGATNHFESCGFIRSRAGLKWPDIQYHFLPAAMRYDGQAAFDGHGYQVHVGPNKPKSRGAINITSPDPDAHPRIVFNYLQEQQDIEDWRAVIRLTREILQQSALAAWRGDEIQPGLHITSDDDIDAWVRQNVESAYHPSCTAKMGRDDDPHAVLDSECRVRGVKGLRVVDSSIFPVITNGNLNAPTIMVAEKAADMILGKPALPAADVPVWIHPDHANSQR